jgi:hypothetical protein
MVWFEISLSQKKKFHIYQTEHPKVKTGKPIAAMTAVLSYPASGGLRFVLNPGPGKNETTELHASNE